MDACFYMLAGYLVEIGSYCYTCAFFSFTSFLCEPWIWKIEKSHQRGLHANQPSMCLDPHLLALWNRLKPSSKIFLLVIPRRYLFCGSLVFLCLVVVCSLLPCGHLLSCHLFPMFHCIFVTFQCGILGQVWYLILSIPDVCHLSYSAGGSNRTFLQACWGLMYCKYTYHCLLTRNRPTCFKIANFWDAISPFLKELQPLELNLNTLLYLCS